MNEAEFDFFITRILEQQKNIEVLFDEVNYCVHEIEDIKRSDIYGRKMDSESNKEAWFT